MSKELEALEDIILYLNASEPKGLYCENIETIQQALLELQSIKKAKPSEALECLDKLVKQIELDEDTDYWEIRNAHITVEQALLKAEKEHKALEILKRNIKVSFDYVKEGKDISFALVFYIDNKKNIYIVDEAIKEQNPEHFTELELLKEVLE